MLRKYQHKLLAFFPTLYTKRTNQFTPALVTAGPKKMKKLQNLLAYFQGIWDLPRLRCYIKAGNLFCRNDEIEESFWGPSLRFTSEM